MATPTRTLRGTKNAAMTAAGFQEAFERIVENALYAALHRGQAFDIDFRLLRPDGSVRILHEQGEIVRDRGGQTPGGGELFRVEQDLFDAPPLELAET